MNVSVVPSEEGVNQTTQDLVDALAGRIKELIGRVNGSELLHYCEAYQILVTLCLDHSCKLSRRSDKYQCRPCSELQGFPADHDGSKVSQAQGQSDCSFVVQTLDITSTCNSSSDDMPSPVERDSR